MFCGEEVGPGEGAPPGVECGVGDDEAGDWCVLFGVDERENPADGGWRGEVVESRERLVIGGRTFAQEESVGGVDAFGWEGLEATHKRHGLRVLTMAGPRRGWTARMLGVR